MMTRNATKIGRATKTENPLIFTVVVAFPVIVVFPVIVILLAFWGQNEPFLGSQDSWARSTVEVPCHPVSHVTF